MAISSYYTYGTNLRNKEFFTSTVNTNNGQKRYFSNIDAEIYFGNEDITHEILDFNFSVEEKKLPIYSYNKFIPDLIAPGQRIVQGTFALNFTEGAFMRNLLSKIDNSIYNTTYFEEETYNPGGEAKNRALWNKNFDITLGYGDYKSETPSYNATCQMICGVQIMSMQKAISARTGEPILEIYSFIGKDFIDEEIDEYISNNTTIDSSNNNNEDVNGSKHIIQYSTFYHPGFPSYITVSIESDNEYVDLNTLSEQATLEILDKSIITELDNDSLKTINLSMHSSNKYYIASSAKNSKLYDLLKERFNEDSTDSIKCNFKHKVQINKTEQDLSCDIYIRLGESLIL